jgi:hypothetical protein
MDPENDKNQIADLKKLKNHPKIVKISFLLDGILKLKLTAEDYSL